jgi:hypothetical protein
MYLGGLMIYEFPEEVGKTVVSLIAAVTVKVS